MTLFSDEAWYYGAGRALSGEQPRILTRMGTADYDNACAMLAGIHEDDIDPDECFKGVVERLNIELDNNDAIALLLIEADPKGVAKWTENNTFDTRIQLARVLLNSWELNRVRAERRRAKKKNGR